MPLHATSGRRQAATAFMLLLALAGLLLRWWAPNPSRLRDFSSLMLVLWVPIAGNVIGWVRNRMQPRVMPGVFGADMPFVPSGQVEVTLRAPDVPSAGRPLPPGFTTCALVVGGEGFTARVMVVPDQVPQPDVPVPLELQFLRPEVAQAGLPAGTAFSLLAGRTLLGTGRVLQQYPAG